ncbi:MULTISPECIES: hypothetical protein [unclassified Microbacterium]|uniref:hypothetical protein n=1 Tax=unclassified Microbacterium TaxID=2609290 RepID=UPI00214C1EE0|nr:MULTISPECIES: hypothetical protein [unclassified Microbacterium]MCR2809953.1 hypothetical protein [Microbacterium sp. zg.B185]WIM17742.1 hypothetical protein QNO12_08900 [Microbacterium sp. zg-B185]
MIGLRKALAIVSLWLPAAAILSTWALWSGRLPGQLPTHWGNSGPADSATDAATFLGWLVAVAIGAALIGTILLLIPMSGKWEQRAIGGITAATGAFVFGMWLGALLRHSMSPTRTRWSLARGSFRP